MIVTLLTLAAASELRPVRAGETLESIAAERGHDVLPALRELNGLRPGQQPAIGTLLKMPEPVGDHGVQEAFLVALTGGGTFTDASGAVAPARTFEPVPAGTTVCTDAFATLRLASTCTTDGSTVDDLVLDPGTCVVVDSAFSSTRGRASVVTLTKGSVAVQHVPDGTGHITLRTRSGQTTGAEGGYRVTLEPDAARTEALQAEVAVQGAGVEVGLQPGQGSRVVTGQAPSAAVDLLQPGALILPGVGDPLRRPSFSWSPVDGAMGYRFEIAADAAFRDVIYAENVPGTPYEPSPLMLPVRAQERLYWRVASFDRFGFLGVPSVGRPITLPAGVGR